jgi:putative hydrolase of the HAD superfamily
MPPTTIDAVLFDADRVIQRPTSDLWAALKSVGSRIGAGDQLVEDLLSAENRSLTGQRDFKQAIIEILDRWGSTISPSEILDLWHHFETEPVVMSLIQQLRANGVDCHLATNQQTYRRNVMHDERHYGDWFDQTFYSCDLGVAKPAPAFFEAILRSIDRPADSVLFIDDRQINLAGAKSVGIHAERFHLAEGADALRILLKRYGLPLGVWPS